MTTGASSPYGLPPDEAIKWFRQKHYRISFDWQDTWREEHARAFTVAKATQLKVLGDIRKAVDQAIARGESLQQFQNGLVPKLVKAGWWKPTNRTTVDVVDAMGNQVKDANGNVLQREVQLGSPRRLQIIYETNLRAAQAAGRWERIQRVKDRRPYLRYVSLLDGRERKAHQAWHGTLLPVDHEWWHLHYPPNGWGCRCKVQQLSDADLRRFGLSESPTPPTPVDNSDGIDPSFDYNVGTAREQPLPRSANPAWLTTPRSTPGILNESHKQFRPNERPIADYLVEQGNDVSSRSEKDKVAGRGRKYDALVNGAPTEFKRPTEGDNIGDLLRDSADGAGQAPNVIFDVRGLPIDELSARREVAVARRHLHKRIHHVRIIGDGFDVTISV